MHKNLFSLPPDNKTPNLVGPCWHALYTDDMRVCDNSCLLIDKDPEKHSKRMSAWSPTDGVPTKTL